MFSFSSRFVSFSAVAALAAAGSSALAAPAAPVHIRGAIASVQGKVMTVTSASGPIRVQFAAKTPVVSVVPSDRAHIKDGSFLGIASRPQANGTQRALEVVVFPEAARGTGEGSYAWDLPGSGAHSKMTNGTVSHSTMTNGTASRMTNGTASRMTNGTAHGSRMTNGTAHKAGGTALTLQYKSGAGSGSQMISLPANIPVVTFAPGSASQLAPGAHVFVIGKRLPNGTVAADRVLVGKNGLVPPM